MSEKIVTLNEEVIKGEIRELVRGSVEETLNNLLEAEADRLTQARRYERSEDRQGYRSGHYDRGLTTTSGEVTLHVPRLKGISFETAIIERYRRRESSVEEALIEMYLAGVSVRRVEDITEALWGSRVSPSTISELNKKAYVNIENWRKRPLTGRYPYVYVDGVYLKRNWGGEYENVSILVAVGVAEDGYREVLGAQEGMKEDKASWQSFFQWLKGRGLDGVRLVVGDKCLGMLEAVGEVFPEAKYQRCIVHFYWNVFTVTPRGRMKDVTRMLKAIHAQETLVAARETAQAVVQRLRGMRLKGISFETAIIERYRRRESSVEEALIEMYLAGVSVRRVEDITEALWGSRVSPSTISELNKKAYVNIENWRKRPLTGRYPYVYVDGVYLKRNWGGEYENVSILVAVGVAEDGYREVLGAQEGMKEDKASWQSFFKWLKGRGLDGVRLVVGDKCLGMLEAVGEVFPEAKYQRCIVHFYRNVFTVTPRGKMRDVTHMLKAIHAQETREAAREKAQAVVQKLREMRLKEAAKKVEDGIEETLTYYAFPSEHWLRSC